MKVHAYSMLRMKVLHTYFLNRTWKGVTFQVAASSRKTLEAHRLHIRAVEGGFCLVRTVRDMGRNPAPMERLTPFKVRLHMQVMDPYYFNYTALPSSEIRKEALYFTNLGEDGQYRSGALSLAESVSAADYFPVHPPQFEVETEQAPGTVVTVRDVHGHVVTETAVQGNGHALVDLSGVEMGRYALEMAGMSPQWVVTTDHWGPRPAAILDLHLDPRGAAFTGKEETQVQLQFEAREIFWRYNVQLGKRNYAAETLEVKDPDHHLSFDQGEMVTVDDASQLQIISAEPVRLQERYPFSLDLVQTSTNLVLASRLPFPDFRNFKQHPGKQGEYLAETFVSL